jgi:serine/threonine-protein kinase
VGFYCPQCGQDAADAGTCARDGTPLARVSSHDLLGRKIGDYLALANLGGGTFGQVYRAVQPRSGAVVAIKLLRQPIDDASRVITEARAAAMIRHGNVVAVYDLGLTADRRPYIVMQHLEGVSLRRWLVPGIGLDRLVPIASDILRGLAAAHRLGVVHRDLKPDNVFVTLKPAPRAIIVDFGLAKLIADPHSPNLTVTGESIGTPRYMAPEQIRCHAIDGRTDLYALGVMLYEALAGRPPFTDEATYALFDAHVNRPPPALTELRPDLPPAACAVIERALEKDPAARFSGADEMRRALATAMAKPRSFVSRRWPWLVAGGLAIAAGATALALAKGPADEPARVADEPALPASYENALANVAASLDHNFYRRVDIVRMACPIASTLADRGVVMDRTYRAYMRRLLDLYQRHADIDLATACRPR